MSLDGSQSLSAHSALGYNAGVNALETQLARLLARYPQIRLAVLFGSQATGQAGPGSDIDLGLLGNDPIPADLELELVEAIGKQCGRPVDIVDLHDAAEPVLGQVLKGRRLFGDNPAFARLLTRHLLNTADFLPLQQRILAERRAAWIN
ncbi:MAG: nucleotidyltransferase domain-containing protein [Halioglobus sp.]|nr:nucleotidyltransferase domain-containing protein [Halioglobus sp.]